MSNRINEGFKQTRVSSDLFDWEQELKKPKKIKKDASQFQVYINRKVIVCSKCFEACKLPTDEINDEQTREVINQFKTEHRCPIN